MPDLRPLRSKAFRHLAAAYWVNEFGNWIGEIALTILTYNRSHSPLATAAFFLSVRFLPALLAPLVTARVEAIRPRVTLPALYCMEALFFAGLALLTQHFSMPAVFALGALDAVLAITAKALTRGATATGLKQLGLLREGNAILYLGALAATAGSPVIAGAVVAWKGAGTALVIDAATFLLTAGIVASASGISLDSDREASLERRVKAGLAVVREQVTVRRLMLVNALFWIFGSVAVPVEVVFAKSTLHAGDSGYGLMLASWGVGTVLGGAGFAALPNMRLVRVLGIGLALVAVGYASLALAPSLLLACCGSLVGGTGNGCGWIALVTAIQERTPGTAQSAVMSIFEGVTQLMPAIGFAAGGAIAAVTSPRGAFAVSAAGVALLAAILAARPIDQVRLGTVPEPAPGTSSTGEAAVVMQEYEASGRTAQAGKLSLG